ncbi:MAG: ATP-dependent helicase, partial [Cyclobacteriaceae bacterium]
MKVSAAQPFQVIYSMYQHEYLGCLFESFIVHLDDKGRLTYQHQNISAKNAREFSKGLDDRDYQLIDLMDKMGHDVLLKKFSVKPMKPQEFFAKTYDKQKGSELLQEQIEIYLEGLRAAILEKMRGKMLFEMGNDGEPTWRKVEVLEKRASIQFHFTRSNENTNYYPTITYESKKVEVPNVNAYLICKNPAWLVVNGKLYGFDKRVDGQKLQPFLSKKFVVIPKNMEETYYNRFVAPLIASFDDVEVNGFEINKSEYDPHPLLSLSELPPANTREVKTLFETVRDDSAPSDDEAGKIVFDLSFKYGKHRFRGDMISPVNVTVEKKDDDYIFHRIKRN